MKKTKDKISTTLAEIKKLAKKLGGKRTVLCHGHFNVIHPGHRRFLQHAREQGDILIAGVLGDKRLPADEQRSFFQQDERAENLASLSDVDSVVVLDNISLEDLIKTLRPDTWIMGKEFEIERAAEITNAAEAVRKYEGRLVFHSGEVQYASTALFDSNTESLQEKRTSHFTRVCQQNKISPSSLKNRLGKFSNLKILVVGDAIVDQYVACDPLGMSAEAPVLVVKELENREFIGGAAVVANHIQSLGAKCEFVSVIGKDSPGNLLKKALKEKGVGLHVVVDEDRPTTFKIRYMVENQRILRVSRLQEQSVSVLIEKKLNRMLTKLIPEMDGVVISDFVYGVITPRILENIVKIAKKHGVKLFGDLQCSSQIGSVLKFENFDMICPTEREARIALGDNESGLEHIARTLLEQTNSTNLVITLGADGLVAYQRNPTDSEQIKWQHFPALITNPVDVAGAGDALLSAMAIGICSGASLMEASALSTCVAAIAVNRIGNIPVANEELTDFLSSLPGK